MSKNIHDELIEIIRIFGSVPDARRIYTITTYKYLQKLKKEIIKLDVDSAGNKIGELKENIERKGILYRDLRPYLFIFLAYAYVLKNIKADALTYAQKAKLYAWAISCDSALAYWFLGILYYHNDFIEEARRELLAAQEEFMRHKNNAHSTHDYDREKKCETVINKIKEKIKILPRRSWTPKPSSYEEPEQRTGTAKPIAPPPSGRNGRGNGGGARKDNDAKNQNKEDGNPLPQMTININVPVDIHSPNYLKQDLWQHQISTQGVPPYLIPPLENEYPPKPDHPDGTPPPDKIINSITTASFPIYGSATAGPDGAVVLDEPESFNTNNQTSIISLNAEDYEVYSLYDDQIRITQNNFLYSLLGLQASKKINIQGKRYGWLKVAGNSMNTAKPREINNNDYVLFIENQDPDICRNKIVVATLPTSETQSARLMIKRFLIKQSNFKNLKTGKNNRILYILRSESKGPSFEDIYLSEEYQLVGIVIAIARPVV